MYRPLKPEKWALSSGHTYSEPHPIAIAEISGKVNKWLKYKPLHCIEGITLIYAELQLDYIVPIPLLILVFHCMLYCMLRWVSSNFSDYAQDIKQIPGKVLMSI